MASPQLLRRMHPLIWVLIYGGLITLVLGIATARTDDTLGWSLGVVGGVVTAVGVALIAVRTRLRPDAPR